MSVRIHQLSKDIGMENKELLALLRSRGFEVKSASSTIDNINADAIREEFTQPTEAAPEETAAEKPAPEEAAAEPEEKPAAPQIPAGAFVKSAEDIKREREAKAAAEKAKAEADKPALRSAAEKPAESKPETESAGTSRWWSTEAAVTAGRRPAETAVTASRWSAQAAQPASSADASAAKRCPDSGRWGRGLR